MLLFLLKRLASASIILLVTSLLAYVLIYLAPGDPAQVIAAQRTGHPANQAEIAYIRTAYGLDQPVMVQYGRWLGQVVRGDFGYSIRSGELISNEIRLRLGATLLLAGATLLFSVLLGLPLGVAAALRAGSAWDELLRVVALFSVAIPPFWLAFLLIVVFAISLHMLPSYGLRGGESFVLPVITLGLGNAARVSRFSRSLMLDALPQGYTQTARAKGLREQMIWWRHVLPNIGVPLITLLTMQFSSIATGVVIIETLFAWPGLGTYYVNAVNGRDLPVLQAMMLFFALLAVGVNLLADVVYALLDPRVRFA